MYSLNPIAAYYSTRACKVSKKYRNSIKSTRYRYRIFRRYRYFKNDPIPDTSSTRYRFRPISTFDILVREILFYSYPLVLFLDSINIKILNAGAWSRASERTDVTLPRELEDYIPAVEEFYRVKHSGRKLQWHHHMSNGTVSIPLGWEEV